MSGNAIWQKAPDLQKLAKMGVGPKHADDADNAGDADDADT